MLNWISFIAFDKSVCILSLFSFFNSKSSSLSLSLLYSLVFPKRGNIIIFSSILITKSGGGSSSSGDSVAGSLEDNVEVHTEDTTEKEK